METIGIAFITAFVTILLNHLFEVHREKIYQKRELKINFYAKIKKAEVEIFELILRINYGWGNPEEYENRISKAQQVYNKILNEFYEVLLFNEKEREMTKKVITSFVDNIIDKIIDSQFDIKCKKEAFHYYENDLQILTENLRKLYLRRF
jgi:hypothetical protein